MCSLVCTWQIIVRDKRGDPLLTKELDARYTGCRERKRERGWGEISQWYNSVLFRCTMCMQNLLSLVPSSLLSVTCSMVKQESFSHEVFCTRVSGRSLVSFPMLQILFNQLHAQCYVCMTVAPHWLGMCLVSFALLAVLSSLHARLYPFYLCWCHLWWEKIPGSLPLTQLQAMESRREGLETKLPNVKISYRPVSQETFEGVNFREFWGFVTTCKNFLHEIGGGGGVVGIFWCWQRRAIRESFLHQNLIAAHSWIFFPLKVSHCTVIVICHFSGQWKSTDWPFIKFTCFRTVLPSSWCCPGGSGGESCTCHAPLSRSPCGGGPSVSAWMCPVIGQAH